jgi:hypothetical protein
VLEKISSVTMDSDKTEHAAQETFFGNVSYNSLTRQTASPTKRGASWFATRLLNRVVKDHPLCSVR